MGDAILAWVIMAAIAAGFVGLMILVNKRQKRLREERRQRWAAMGLGDLPLYGGGAAAGGGIIFGGVTDFGGGSDTGGGGACGGGGGCGGGGCGGGGCGGGGG
jgi:hypothetical protein